MRYSFIDANKALVPIERQCELLGVSASGYYAWKGRPWSGRRVADEGYLNQIRVQFALSNRTYGSPRMTAELRAGGASIGRGRVARLMRENGLKAVQRQRYRRTTDSHHLHPVAENLLDQDFSCARPNQKWGADISYLRTREGWLYLAIVVDFYSRRIVGWAVSDRLKQELALAALQKAVTQRRPVTTPIHHSDRGSQYCAGDYQKYLRDHGLESSMSGKGNCYDNAMVETVFKSIKSELVWQILFNTRIEATLALEKYIDRFYKPRRRHSALGYCSPIEFEMINATTTELMSLY